MRLIYLDTHVVVWYYAQDKTRFPEATQRLLNQHDWYISPIVQVELQFLHESGRINPTADEILEELSAQVGLQLCTKPFTEVVSKASRLAWTRDPFDRIIVAQAALDSNLLITKDRSIHNHYQLARWAIDSDHTPTQSHQSGL